MFRLTAFLKRTDTIGRDAFLDHLVDIWGPAVAAGQKGLKKLLINLPLDLSGTALADVFPPRFDALVELHYPDQDSALREIARFAHAPDEARLDGWIDPADSAVFLGEVRPKKPDSWGDTGVRMSVAGHVVDGMAVEDAQRYWNDVHPVVAQRAPETWNRLTLYTQVHGRDMGGKGLAAWLGPHRPFPMCADMGAVSIDELLAAYGNEQYMAIVRPDEQKFSKPEEMLTFVTDRTIAVLDQA